MKKILLIAFFLRLLTSTAFSQIEKQPLVTTLKQKDPLTLQYGKENKGFAFYQKGSKKPLAAYLPEITFNKKQDVLTIKDNSKSNGEMPCLIPNGYFPMDIAKPDSTTRYTLLIKEI
ncbi:MAG: hypothetical protein AB7S48_16950 [Bacteroidales bacterium]